MREDLHKILQSVRDGSVSVQDAELLLKKAPFEDLGYAKIDYHRSLRQGASHIHMALHQFMLHFATPLQKDYIIFE